MKWISTKVIPFAARNYPGMQIVPVIDNAPYHHVRSIPSLTRFSKKITVNLTKDHDIDYALLPLTDEQISLPPKQYNHNINNGHLRITFNEEELQKRKTKLKSLKTSSAEELKVATVVWMEGHKHEVLI